MTEFAAFRAPVLAELTTIESVSIFFAHVPEGVCTESYENLENTGCVAFKPLILVRTSLHTLCTKLGSAKQHWVSFLYTRFNPYRTNVENRVSS